MSIREAPEAGRELPDPNGYAVLTADGYFVGIWRDREVAEKVLARSPMAKGERIVEYRPVSPALLRALEAREGCVMTGAEKDTLIALVERGPLWDGDVPSKAGRDSLLAQGLAVRVVVKGEDGWQAATYAGRDVYKMLFPGPEGAADTISEAKANRKMQRAIDQARQS